MGYESSLYLVDVKIKRESVRSVSRALKTKKVRGFDDSSFFLEVAAIDSAGFLAFRTTEDRFSAYVADEEDGTVPALSGVWDDAEIIARWLRRHSENGGRMILHREVGDVAAWGWEFDGKGRMRPLGLVPVGKWE